MQAFFLVRAVRDELDKFWHVLVADGTRAHFRPAHFHFDNALGIETRGAIHDVAVFRIILAREKLHFRSMQYERNTGTGVNRMYVAGQLFGACQQTLDFRRCV